MNRSEAKRREARPADNLVNVILTQSMPVHSVKSEQKLDEHGRLLEARESTAPWRQGARISSSDNGVPSAWSEVEVRNWHRSDELIRIERVGSLASSGRA